MFKILARAYYYFSGWKIVGKVPAESCVIVGAFHTSNWDAFPALGANELTESNVYWMAKSSLFWWPLGAIMRALGGVPVDRGSHEDVVAGAVHRFKTKPRFKLALSPEATRKKNSHWKTGFYYIARDAKVPLVGCGLDYKNRHLVFSPPIYLSSDPQADISKLREFFRPFVPKHPEQADPNFTVDIK